MKKLCALILAMCMVLSLAACGGNEPVSTPDTESIDAGATVGTTTTTANGGEDADKTEAPTSTTGTTAGKQETPSTTTTTKPTPSTTGTTAHVHEYGAASCLSPAKCSCGATKGSALAHNYAPATCTAPETCKYCFATKGSALGHSYSNKACTVCKMRAPSEGLTHTPTSDGSGLLVSGIGSCTDEHLVIGPQYKGVSPRAFERNKTIKSVIFTEGATQIRYDAFTDCTALTYVVIPASVTQVQYNAFYNCTALTDIYCEGTAEGENWDATWKQGCNAKVHWGGTWKFVDGKPVANK